MPDPAGVPLHGAVAPLGFLLGTWRGGGEGDYPTVEAFAYSEESVFWHVGKPFIGYSQRTWSADGTTPSHSETGFWRGTGTTGVELVLAHSNGLVEVSEGHLVGPRHPEGGTTIRLSSVMVGTTSAKEVTALAREISVVGDEMSYTLEMSAVGVPLGLHLRGRLRRVTGSA